MCLKRFQRTVLSLYPRASEHRPQICEPRLHGPLWWLLIIGSTGSFGVFTGERPWDPNFRDLHSLSLLKIIAG